MRAIVLIKVRGFSVLTLLLGTYESTRITCSVTEVRYVRFYDWTKT